MLGSPNEAFGSATSGRAQLKTGGMVAGVRCFFFFNFFQFFFSGPDPARGNSPFSTGLFQTFFDPTCSGGPRFSRAQRPKEDFVTLGCKPLFVGHRLYENFESLASVLTDHWDPFNSLPPKMGQGTDIIVLTVDKTSV